MDTKAIDVYLEKLQNGEKVDYSHLDDADIADYLQDIKGDNEKKFFEFLQSLPLNLRAETFIELPIPFQIDLIIKYSPLQLTQIIQSLNSDDATDLYITISKINEEKQEEVFELLDDSTQKNIEKLIIYKDDEAGSLMQTEIFKVSYDKTIAYAIEKLADLKKEGIGKVDSVFIIDEHDKFIKSISLDDLILENKEQSFKDILDKYPNEYSVHSHESIDELLQKIEKYDLRSIAVIDKKKHLLGRITHDDIIDKMQEVATQQIYNLHKIDKDEHIQESFKKTAQTRAKWLLVNLINVTLASIVIGLFEETLDAIVALAVLMPIVANMAGTAASQTMTVIVRQLALGEIDFNDIGSILKKELTASFINGLFFGVLTGIISQVRYDDIFISLSISLAMLFSFVMASVIGTSMPMLLKKFNVDPAVASSVFVLTLVDIVGFFSFLWIAKIIIL